MGCVFVQDELLWAAAWLYRATNNRYYLNYLGNNGNPMGGTGWDMTEFSWDVKYAGVQTLVAKVHYPYQRSHDSLPRILSNPPGFSIVNEFQHRPDRIS